MKSSREKNQKRAVIVGREAVVRLYDYESGCSFHYVWFAPVLAIASCAQHLREVFATSSPSKKHQRGTKWRGCVVAEIDTCCHRG